MPMMSGRELRLKFQVKLTGVDGFRMDLFDYVKVHGELNNVPNGMHAVVLVMPEIAPSPGAIFTLRNRALSSKTGDNNLNQHNRLYPFYLVYICCEVKIIHDYTGVKLLLDLVRSCCKVQDKPIVEFCQCFNRETADGRQMHINFDLLGQPILSMNEVKAVKEPDGLFSGGKTTALTQQHLGVG